MTINEKLDAVVAECERRCPKTYDIAKYQWGCLHSTGQFCNRLGLSGGNVLSAVDSALAEWKGGQGE